MNPMLLNPIAFGIGIDLVLVLLPIVLTSFKSIHRDAYICKSTINMFFPITVHIDNLMHCIVVTIKEVVEFYTVLPTFKSVRYINLPQVK